MKIVSKEKAFYFFTSIGNYTGESAASLKEFMDKVNTVDIESLEFHLSRGDFAKWTAEVLEDKKLAEDLRRLQTSGVHDDVIRSQLYITISRRYRELTSPPKASVTKSWR